MFFREGGGVQFSTKNKLKSGLLNDKKVYKQECFSQSKLIIQTGKFLVRI